MKIEYYGHSCFRITDQCGVSLITDPYTEVGFELPPYLTSDIVTVSHGHYDHNATHKIFAHAVVDKVEAVRINGITIRGVLTSHDDCSGLLRGKNIVFIWKMDDLTVCHLGDIGQPISSSFLQQIGGVDVLLIPVGGTYTIDAAQAFAYVSSIQPKIVIPMHYKPADGTIDITDEKPFLHLFNHVEYVGARAVELTKEAVARQNCKVIFMERINQ